MSIATFSSPCFDVPKTLNFISGGVQNRETKNSKLGMIVTSFQDLKLRGKQIFPIFSYFLISNALLFYFLASLLAHNKKMNEKSVFREALRPEMKSQSFPVPSFGLVVLYHTGSEISRFRYIQNTEKENRYRICFWAILMSTLWRFYRAN